MLRTWLRIDVLREEEHKLEDVDQANSLANPLVVRIARHDGLKVLCLDVDTR